MSDHPLTSTLRRPRPDFNAVVPMFGTSVKRPGTVGSPKAKPSLVHETDLFGSRSPSSRTQTPKGTGTPKHGDFPQPPRAGVFAPINLSLSSPHASPKASSVRASPKACNASIQVTLTQTRVPLFVEDAGTGTVSCVRGASASPHAANRPPRTPKAGVRAPASTRRSLAESLGGVGTSVHGGSQPPSKAGSGGPPTASAFDSDAPLPTDLVLNRFELMYLRSDLPVKIDYSASNKRTLVLTKDAADLDVLHWIPIFFQGLVLTEQPLPFFCQEGLKLLLPAAGERLIECLPACLDPLLLLPLRPLLLMPLLELLG